MTNNRFVRKNLVFDKIDIEIAKEYSRALQSVKVKEKNGRYNMPAKIGFYELFGKVISADDILLNWDHNTTKDSILAPIGISEEGEILSIDFHEKNIY